MRRREETKPVGLSAAARPRRLPPTLPDYGTVTIATGDRVICRRNDVDVDVDNGTRGTVRATHEDRIVVETDAGTIRELPAGYVAEHVEHAYCLTGHGMQGGTVEHATVLATPRDLTKGWSYTALSRARGETRLHIDAADLTATLDRHELGGADKPKRPDREQVLARAGAQMLDSDDEDLALSQLPPQAAPGRPDDRAIQTKPAPVSPERGAERDQLQPSRPISLQHLRELQSEREQLLAQREALPLPELRQLDAIATERARVNEQRRDVADRLQDLPDPSRSVLGRSRDPRAAERARLTAGVAAADQQIAALDTQAGRLERALGPAAAVREERAGLDRRVDELEHDVRQVRDELAEQVVASPPVWAHELLGPRPEQYRRAEHWDRAVRDVARYRIEHDVSEDTPEVVRSLVEL